MKIIDDSIFPLDVPASVQCCNYCEDETPLYVSAVEEYARDDESGLWFASQIVLECPNDDLFDDSHTFYPYENWIPAIDVVTDWINQNFRFDLDHRIRQRNLKPCDFLTWPNNAKD